MLVAEHMIMHKSQVKFSLFFLAEKDLLDHFINRNMGIIFFVDKRLAKFLS